MSDDETGWEHALFAELDDLESQATAAFAQARREEVSDRAHAEYLGVTLASRLMAELGHEVTMQLEGIGSISGVIDDVGAGWISLAVHHRQWIVRQVTVTEVHNVGRRSVPEAVWPLSGKLRLHSPVRRLIDDSATCLFRLRNGATVEGVPSRIGLDFIEVATTANQRLDLVPIPTLTAIQRR